MKKFKDDIAQAEEKVSDLEAQKEELEQKIPEMESAEREKTQHVAKLQDERIATQEKLAQLQSKLNDAKGNQITLFKIYSKLQGESL